MPFTVADVEKHKKGLGSEQKKAWVSIANSVLTKCTGPASECDGRAIRIANAKAAAKDLATMASKAFAGDDEAQIDLKCFDEHFVVFGGAESFEDLDLWRESREMIWEAEDVMRDARQLIDNIVGDEGPIDRSAVENVIAQAGARARAVFAGDVETDDRSLRRLLVKALGPLLRRAHDDDDEDDEDEDGKKKIADKSILFTKDAETGRPRVTLLASINARDREGEILSAAGAEANVKAWQSGLWPEFWLWHVKGTRFGVADNAALIDNVTVVTGLVDPGMEHVAETIEKQLDDLSVSHGFAVVRRDVSDPTIVDRWFTFEVSVLPRENAAIPFLGADVTKEADMPDAKQKEWLTSVLGDEAGARTADGIDAVNKAADAIGLDRKDADGDGDGADATSTDATTSDDAGDKTPPDISAAVQKAIAEQVPAAVTEALKEPVGMLAKMIGDVGPLAQVAELLARSDDERLAAIFTAAKGAADGPASANVTNVISAPAAAAIGEPHGESTTGADEGAGDPGAPMTPARFFNVQRRSAGEPTEAQPVTG